jgi:acetyl-CoA C-acetyltransferase
MSLKPLARGVSIVGVGITQFGDGDDVKTPQLKNMSLQDMAAWACIDAMEDGGVNPRQIDKLIVGRVCTTDGNSDCICPNHGFLEWIGMQGKASTHHSDACATPFTILNEAILSIASGRYDVVMVVDSDSARHITAPDKPSHIMYPKPDYKKLYGRNPPTGDSCQDTAYNRWVGGGFSTLDACGRRYIRESGITIDEFEDALSGQAITARYHGSLNPKAYAREKWEDVASKRGYDDTLEFMKSKYVPKLAEYMRTSTFAVLSEGAAALIVCATEIADQFKQKPIEVVNLAQFDMGGLWAQLTPKMNRGVAQQLYDVTGYKPEDIEYFQTTDGDLSDALDSAEASGYLPKGEGWKFFRDGLTRFDSEKPMNTDGGHQCYGHAFGATGVATVGECVMQMRGQAGERQIPKPPKVSMMRGWGSGQSVSQYIFKTSDINQKGVGTGKPKFTPEPITRKFYEGLDEGKFLGMKCPECGRIEFPAYPVCNECGHIGNEWVELSGNATILEVYEIYPTFTTPAFAMFAPLYSAEVLPEGCRTPFLSLLFGLTKESYPDVRDNIIPKGPMQGKLVVLPRDGFNTFAVGVNGAVPSVGGTPVSTNAFETFLTGQLGKEE